MNRPRRFTRLKRIIRAIIESFTQLFAELGGWRY